MASLSRETVFAQVPPNISAWRAAARDLKVSRSSINCKTDLQSGSRVTQAQFALYKAYWPAPLPASMLNMAALNLGNEFQQADAWLGTFAPFQAYLLSLRAVAGITIYGPGNTHDLGIFELVRHQQLAVLRTNSVLVRDEDSVNFGLISLLQALTIKHPLQTGEWMMQKLALRANFLKGTYTARVDGFLCSASTDQAQFLVEVKPRRRLFEEPQVSMQETSEIVAFIKTRGIRQATQRPVMFSQDHAEIFMSTMSFTANYSDYLNGARRNLAGGDFLVIQRYGPWRIDNENHMRHLGAVIIATSIRYGQ